MDLENKRILITGGSGFVGRHLVDILQEKGCKLIFTPTHDLCDLVKEKDVEETFRIIKPDIVIHLAAKVGGIGANKSNPGKFFYDNLMMGAHIIEQSRIHDVEKVVVVGTICSYPKFTNVPFVEGDLWKGYPEETNAPYGIAKKVLLTQCQAYREQYGLNAVYLLPVNLYGPGDNFDLETSHVIPAIINKVHDAVVNEKDRIECWGSGSVTREFLFVKDLVKAIYLAVLKLEKPYPINIGSGQEISIHNLVHKIIDLMGFEGKILWDISKPNGQPRRCLDTSLAKEVFGFEAETSLEDGLKETIEWYKESVHFRESIISNR